jgi:hypothetical protein
MNAPQVREVEASEQAIKSSGLPKIDFADGYRGQVGAVGILARDAAQAIFQKPPRFAAVLMSLRNRLMSLFGLKTPKPAHHSDKQSNRIGIFPVLSETMEEIVLGMDDKHLDFRICVSVQAGAQHAPQVSHITLSTLVRSHNLFGRLYLMAVMPFHRFLSRHMLQRALMSFANPTAAERSPADRAETDPDA